MKYSILKIITCLVAVAFCVLFSSGKQVGETTSEKQSFEEMLSKIAEELNASWIKDQQKAIVLNEPVNETQFKLATLVQAFDLAENRQMDQLLPYLLLQIANLQHQLGFQHLSDKNADKVLMMLKTITVAKEIRNVILIETLVLKGALCHLQSHVDSAKAYFHQAQQLITTSKHLPELSILWLGIDYKTYEFTEKLPTDLNAVKLNDLGKVKAYLVKEKLDSAWFHLENLSVNESSLHGLFKQKYLQLMFQYHEVIGDEVGSEHYRKELKQFRIYQKLAQADFMDEIIALQYKIEEKKRESAENSIGSSWLIISTPGSLIGIIIFVLVTTRRKIRKLQTTKLQLEHTLKNREQELTDYSISLLHRDKVMEELVQDLKKSGKFLPENPSRIINKAVQSINFAKQSEKNWEKFNKYFGSIHGNFFENLRKKYPNLSNGDLRQCALLKMNLSAKESAELLGVEPKSVKVARYRTKKKMGLNDEESLVAVLTAIS